MPRVKRRQWTPERIEPRGVLDNMLVLNEIMYHPSDPGEQLELVELFNEAA